MQILQWKIELKAAAQISIGEKWRRCVCVCLYRRASVVKKEEMRRRGWRRKTRKKRKEGEGRDSDRRNRPKDVGIFSRAREPELRRRRPSCILRRPIRRPTKQNKKMFFHPQMDGIHVYNNGCVVGIPLSTGRKCFVIHIHKTKECAIKVQPNSNFPPNYSSSFQIKFDQEFV